MMERPPAGQWLLAVDFQPPTWSHRGGLRTEPQIPSFASLTLDLFLAP